MIREARNNLAGPVLECDSREQQARGDHLLVYARAADSTRLWVGVDYSIGSPGLTLTTGDGTFHSYFLPTPTQQGRHVTLVPSKQPDCRVEIHATAPFPLKPGDFPNRIVRYNALANHFLAIVDEHRERVRASNEQVHVGIEWYAPRSRNSNSVTKLCEAGGILRLFVQQRGYSWVDIPPAAIKRLFTSKGRSVKLDMLVAWNERMGLDDPCVALGSKYSVLERYRTERAERADARTRVERGEEQDEEQEDEEQEDAWEDEQEDEGIDPVTGMPASLEKPLKVPNPVEDIIDSMAILLCIHQDSWARFPPLVFTRATRRSCDVQAQTQRQASDAQQSNAIADETGGEHSPNVGESGAIQPSANVKASSVCARRKKRKRRTQTSSALDTDDEG